MKILQVIHYFPPYSIGGSEFYTWYLSRELSKHHDVRIVFTVPEDGENNRIVRGIYDGMLYWGLKKNRKPSSYPFQDRNRWVEEQFSEIINQFTPDIIHFQHLINLSLALPSIAKRNGIATCCTLHDFWLLCPRTTFLTPQLTRCDHYSARQCFRCTEEEICYYATQKKVRGIWSSGKNEIKKLLNMGKKAEAFVSLTLWRRYWVRKVFNEVDMFIAPSQFLLQRYLQNGLAREKIVFIRHGFNTSMSQQIKKTASATVRFGFIGSLSAHKGIHLLIDAFNRVEGPGELKIYGRIREPIYSSLIKRIKNPNIHLLGELKEEAKAHAFSEIDVLIFPSICYENCPLSIHEAFVANVPVITADIGGMAELVKDGENGLIFRAGDVMNLSEKIQECINNPDILSRLTSHMPAVKDITVNAAEILQLYAQLQSRPAGPSNPEKK